MKIQNKKIGLFLTFVLLSSLSVAGGRPPRNQAPRIVIDPVADVKLPSSAQINATVTDDGRPNPPGQLTFTWTKQAGPGTVIFGSPNSEDTSASFSLPGNYQLRLNASDSQRSRNRNVQVRVLPANQLPIADASLTDLIVQSPTPQANVTLNASASQDPDGQVVFYEWGQNNTGTLVSGATPILLAQLNGYGPHRIFLGVRDNEGAWSNNLEEITIHIVPVNQPPDVDAGPDETVKMTFSGTIGDRKVDGADFNVWQAAFESRPGDARWDPVADIDRSGAVDGNDFLIWQAANGSRPGDSNWDPRADINSGNALTTQLNGVVGDDGLPKPPNRVDSNWTIVSAPSGRAAEFSSSSDPQTNITFYEVGDYVLRLTSTDGEHTSSDTIKIFVCHAVVPNTPPVVNAGPDQVDRMAYKGSIGDGTINKTDFDILTAAFGSRPGDVNWDDLADINWDGYIDGADAGILFSSFGSGPGDPNWHRRADINAGLPLTFQLNGTVTDDGLPNPPATVTTKWRVVDGTGTVTFADDTSLNTTVTFSGPGLFILELEADDGDQKTTDRIEIRVQNATPDNQAPTVEAGPDQTVRMSFSGSVGDGLINNLDFRIFLAAMGSRPGDVNWDPLADINGDGQVTASGDGAAILAALGSQSGDANWNPRADINAGQALTCQLNGSVSDDGLPTPPALTIKWSVMQGSGTVTFADDTDPNTTVTFSDPGLYVLKLHASDGFLKSADTLTKRVLHSTVVPVNQVPVADASRTTTTIEAQDGVVVVVLDGSASFDPDGFIDFYMWTEQGRGNIASSSNAVVSVVLNGFGDHTLFLSVRDNDGAFSTNREEFVIRITSTIVNELPVVSISGDTEVTLPNSANVTASIVDDGVFTLITFWNLFSGPASVAFDNPTGLSTGIEFTTPGTYVIQFTVIDGTNTVVQQTSIEVLPPQAQETALAHDINIFDPTSGQKAVINYLVPPGGANVEITVYTIASEVVKVLLNRFQTAGPKTVEWAGINGSGGSVSSGLYPFTVKIEDKVKKQSAISVLK